MRTRSLAAGAAASALLAAVLVSCGASHRRSTPTTAPATRSVSTTSSTQPRPTGPFAWSRETSPALAVGGGPSSTFSAVVAPAGGRPWTIAGTRESSTSATTATIWTSATGSAWSETGLTGPGVDSHASAAGAWLDSTVVVGWTGLGADTVATTWIARGPHGAFTEVPTGAGPGSTMTAVAGGALGLFAAGTVSGRAALWYSGDGRHWSRLSGADSTVNDSSGPHIQSLVETSDSVLAGGWVGDGNHTDAALWSSSDGVSWRLVSPRQAAFSGGGDRVITSLAPLGNGLNPGGFIVAGGIRVAGTWTPVSWVSPDGQTWSAPSRSFPTGPRPQGNAGGELVSGLSATLAASRLVRMVAVGSGQSAERVWESADGLHWREAALPAPIAASSGWDANLVAANQTTTVIADGDPEQPRVLVDGPHGWQEPSANPAVFGPVRATATPVALAASGSRALLLAEVSGAGQSIGPADRSFALLASSTPSVWVREPATAFAGATVTGLAAGPDRFVAVGTRMIGGRSRAVAWTTPAAGAGSSWTGPVPLDSSTPAYPDAPGGICSSTNDFMAVGALSRPGGSSSPRAWVSTDGVHWRVATTTATGRNVTGGAMTGCAPADVATSARSSAAFEAYGVSSSSVASVFWTSSAGFAWSQAPALIGSGLSAVIEDLAGSGRGWLAVTAGPPDPLTGSRQLYESASGGPPWQRVETSGPVWQGAFGPAELDLVAWIGSLPLLAGSVDHRLTVWSGTLQP